MIRQNKLDMQFDDIGIQKQIRRLIPMKNIYPNKEEKIIQIMPAPQNMFLEYANDEDPNNPFISPVLCLALTNEGEVYLMDVDENGFIDKAESMSNFQGIRWGK